jgi:hypothetical protein
MDSQFEILHSKFFIQRSKKRTPPFLAALVTNSESIYAVGLMVPLTGTVTTGFTLSLV